MKTHDVRLIQGLLLAILAELSPERMQQHWWNVAMLTFVFAIVSGIRDAMKKN